MAAGLFGPTNPSDFTLYGVEPGANRDRPAVKLLASCTNPYALSTTVREMPTGLVLYPSFKADSAIFIDIAMSLTNSSALSGGVRIDITADGVVVASLQSIAITSDASSTTGYCTAKIWIHGSTATSQLIEGYFITQPTSVGATATLTPITFTTTSIDCSLLDVRLRADIDLDRGTGVVKDYRMLQFTPRDGW